MFSEEKVAHIAAYFLIRGKGRLPHIKLIKLMYLADRESMKQYGSPISYDRMVSMPHGPVLSNTLDLINGYSQGIWGEYISDRANHEVSLQKDIKDTQELDALSDADEKILSKIWDQFGSMGKFDLVGYTHKQENCPEWKNPNGSSCSISYEDVYRAVGYSNEQAKELAEELNSYL
ncbi:MAG: Panacea domain-containing protein [Alphaproteobacteria bacterium]